MGLYKRGRVWWVDYFDQSRERIQESSRSTNRRGAESLLNIQKSELLRGVFRRRVKIAFGEFGQRYMEHASINKRSWLRDEQMLKPLGKFFGSERHHTFTSRLVDRGVDIVTVKELLGHSSITVTMRYTHTNLDSKRATVTVTNRVVTFNAART